MFTGMLKGSLLDFLEWCRVRGGGGGGEESLWENPVRGGGVDIYIHITTQFIHLVMIQ